MLRILQNAGSKKIEDIASWAKYQTYNTEILVCSKEIHKTKWGSAGSLS